MISRMTRATAAVGYLCVCLLSAKADDEKANARDMFFAGIESTSPAKPPATRSPAGPRATKPKQSTSNRPGSHIEVSPNRQTSSAQVRFGVRYSVMKVAGLDMVEVSPKSRFRKGDRIQLKVQVNNDGYLYVVHQGTSGAWRVMYPPAGSEKGANQVVAAKQYLVPDALMKFDGNPGTERLFLIVSREPESTLDHLIYTLEEQGAGEQSRPRRGRLSASNHGIDDGIINQLRRSYTRDLVMTKPDEDTASTRSDQALYVVNTTARPDSAVVVDIQLTHQ